MEGKIAFITGATSGIGLATAQVFAENGINLILCGRRQERLEELEKELSTQVKVQILNFDVRDKKAVFEKVTQLPETWKKIDILINNAGNAHGLDTMQEADIEDWDAMIDINVKGLLYVSKAIIPLMLTQNQGHIIHIGSIAGKEVYPKGSVYCASKHAVDAINNGMRMDLNGTNIKVSAVNPGLVETEFSMVRFKGDTEKAKKVYEGYQALTGKDIAEIIAFIVSRPFHVNISDLMVLPQAQAAAHIVHKTV